MAEHPTKRVEWVRISALLAPTGLGELRRWLDRVYLQMPDNYRHTARVEFEPACSEDCEIVVTYERPETDEEMIARKLRAGFGQALELQPRDYHLVDAIAENILTSGSSRDGRG